MLRCILFSARPLLFTAMAMLIQTSTVLRAQDDGRNSFAAVASQDGGVGSTMTLQQLQLGKKSDAVPEPLKVEAAGEPEPALRFRLYPSRSEMKPGSALLHYMRAQMLFSESPKEKQTEWQRLLDQDNHPPDQELAAAVTALQQVYAELHDLAMSEDQMWDHRIRDVRGPAVYSYLLPDVQNARVMARLLRLKIEHQLRQRDFDGALSTIGDVVRLAEFVGQGETLIQKLVGIAIASIVRDSIQQAISLPGCPNLYWALATIPQPLVDINPSVLWELNNIQHILPALSEAETATWTEGESIQKWSSLLDDMKTLGDFGGNDRHTQLSLAIASVTFVDAARERLLAGGAGEERINRLPPLQIVVMDASREIQRVADDLGKSHLLPIHLAEPLLQHEDENFQRWIQANRNSSVGASIAGLLFPAVRQTKQAEARMLLGHNRLMTLEALRMHAATHHGELPESLDALSPVPAMADPYTGKPLAYKVETNGDVTTVVLTAAGPLNFKALQELRVQFVKSK